MQVGALAEKVDLSQSALSQHLAKLRGMHLVKTRREAQTIYYTLESAAVRQMLKALETLYSD
jgi:DNA-binding transcriptional ArsR family regulator